MNDTWLRRLIVLCSAGLFVPLAAPLLTGRVFVASDLIDFHLPLRFLYQSALTHGDNVLWTPALFGGFYLHGEGQLGMFHPLHLALYGLLPLGTAFNLEFLASYVAAFGGMYWLLRRLACGASGALFGAMLFAFCGFQLLHFIQMNVVATTAHVPWLLAAIDVLLMADTPRRRAAGMTGVALVLASEVLLGFPQAVWWSVLAAATFAIVRAAELRRIRRLIACAIAGACALLIGGIQLLPMADLAARSERAVVARDYALTYSLHPLNLLELWAPYVFFTRGFVNRASDPIDRFWPHEFGVYCGAAALILVAWIWIRRDALRAKRLPLMWAGALAVVGMVLALGRYGGLDVVMTYVPLVGAFRAPARYIFLVQFALAILGGIAFDDLADAARNPIRFTRRQLDLLRVPLALAVVTTALVNGQAVFIPDASITRLGTAALGVLPLAAATVLLPFAARKRSWAILALVPLAAVDLGVWGLSYVYAEPPRTVAEAAGPLPVVERRTRVDCAFDCTDAPVMRGYDLVEPYVALYPLSVLPPYEEPFQRLAGVSLELLDYRRLVPRSGALPRARLVADVRSTADAADDIWSIDLTRSALVPQPVPPLSGPPGSARLLTDRPGHIVVETNARGRQLLAIGERFHDGWTAAVDGTSAAVLRVNGDFLGCVVDAGAHRVEFRFRPRSFVLGASLSALGVLTLIAATMRFRRYPARP